MDNNELNENMKIETKAWYFFRMQELVLEDEKLGSYEKLVYTVISKFSDIKNNTAYPSLKTIAKLASCSRSKARQATNTLVETGYINKKIRKQKGKKNKTNIYKIKDLAYISNAIKYAKKENNDKLHTKIKKRLKKHPIPSEKEIYQLIGKYEQNESKNELEKLYESGYR